jgi:putative DNA primase/helicase
MKPDLPVGKKGGEDDVVAVLGFVIDADSDHAGRDKPTLPAGLTANCSIESSAGNEQLFLFINRSLTLVEAKPFGDALRRATNAEFVDDVSHVWRIPGTLNWPNAAKIKRGRSTTPQHVRLASPWDGSLTDVDRLREVLEPHWGTTQPERAATMVQQSKFDVDPVKAEQFLLRLRDAGYFDAGPEARKRYVRAAKACSYDLGDVGREIWERVVCWQGMRGGEGEPVDGKEAERRWYDCSTLKAGVAPVTFGSIIDDARRELGWPKAYLQRDRTAAVMFGDVARLAPPLPAGAVPMIGPGATQAQPAPPEYGEIEIADRFVSDYGKQLSFVTARNMWLAWDGKRWRPDETGYVADLVRRHCRSESALYASTPGTTAAQAKSLCSSKTVSAVVQLARVDQRVASRASDWDQDEWLLGTPDGVVDLKTGTLREAQPEDRVTKSTAVSPADGCPTWLTFLNRVTNGDVELQSYLQRLAGYYLTGSTAEQSLQFVFGPGRSGKGTFRHAISALLADYHVTTPIETLTESKSDRHPTEVAALQGARLVTCSETERGRHWAESRIKQFTGGDEISARFMNQNFFSFVPTFKLLISGNYKPHLRPDTAMRRRFQLLPFMVTIPEREQDKDLGAKLKREWPGILAWMIAGAVAWQREGLNPPAVVLDATREYMDEEAEDVLSTWLADCCDQSETRMESKHSDLYRSYKNYCEQAGERPATSAQLGKELKRLGFEPKRTGPARLVVGLGLRLPPAPPTPLPETYRPQP